MAFEQRSLADYIDVAQRIADFREQYPEGSLQPADPAQPFRIVQADGYDRDGKALGMQTFVVVVAAAYRTPDDLRPGIGMAWEPFPGRTPYTKASELQNAETSAWGRAIVAVGASDSKRGIASREEVRNRQAEREDGLPVNADGSLSRSRTSDEQKDAAGVMTSAQHSEHTQLAKPPPNSGKSERLGPVECPQCAASHWRRNPIGQAQCAECGYTSLVDSPVDDPWMDGPAGLTPEHDPEDQAGTATADQIKQIQTLYTAEFKISDRDKKLDTTRRFLGLDMLASHTQLSYRQAGDLLLAMRTKLAEPKRGAAR